MDKKTTLSLLNRFVDYERLNMNRPFSQELSIGKYLCATNAKIIVLIPETEETKIEDIEGFLPPNINSILPEFIHKIELDFNYLKKLFDEVPIIERFITDECEACDGDGKFEHYGDWYNCKNCKETGEFKTPFKEKVKRPETAFKFKDIKISIENIKRLFEIQNAIGKTEFEFKIMRLGELVIWFKLDEIFIGISRLNNIDCEKNEWTVIDVELEC